MNNADSSTQDIATSLKPGRYVIFDGVACEVKSLQISRTGKHGHAKCRVEAITIKDGRKIIKMMPGHDNVQIPIIEKRNGQVMAVHENMANVMDMDNYETFDLPIPEEIKDQIKEGAQVSYWIVLGEKVIKQAK